MPIRNPQTVNMRSAPPPICLPNARIAASMSLARMTPFRTYSKILMIIPATRPPRITRVQLIFPMAASSNEIWYDSTPRAGEAKGPVAACCYVTEDLKSGFLDGLFFSVADLLFRLAPVVELRAGVVALAHVDYVCSPADSR